MVGEWRCKEEEWKFEPWEGWFGRCVRVKENMTYTEFVRTLCEVFSLKSTECNPIITYWMPGKMSVMIESKRPPVFIDNQMSLDTFFLIRGGDPSVTLFVSFITKALGNTVPRTDGDDGESYRVCGSVTTPIPIVAASNVDGNNEAVDEQDDVEDDKTDDNEEEEEDNEDGAGYDDYQGDDGSMGGSTLDPTIDGSEGSGEDYDYNKWNDVIVEEYGIGNVEEDVILTQQTVQHPGEFSRLLAECTYTSHRVPGGDNSVDRTATESPRHEVSGDDVIDRGIGASPSGTLNDNRLVTAPGGDNISHSGDRTPTVTPRPNRKKVARCKSLVTPEVDERFLQDLPASGKYAVKMSGPWSYQVTNKSGEHFHVVLDECTCTCLRYTKLRIPCEHGLAAKIECGINLKVVVGWCYGIQTFSDSFQEPILPIADRKDDVIPQDISDMILIPPYSRRPPGRPTTKRMRCTYLPISMFRV
ncbi:Zinc finger PMZ-type [Arabidopsis thaliana x Arabidopsis arenosa]|uniref:Zinc finger PMZ-type n=1 Tax=Arabidopsis thaliana x Arabidopsis arenosa TaxID=1240361 RepID=A0A8T2B217_9BRAS|nr:Zinc finger PMZ-type [Arabidopsis thaliana x Arabidopsis arenosa]